MPAEDRLKMFKVRANLMRSKLYGRQLLFSICLVCVLHYLSIAADETLW